MGKKNKNKTAIHEYMHCTLPAAVAGVVLLENIYKYTVLYKRKSTFVVYILTMLLHAYKKQSTQEKK